MKVERFGDMGFVKDNDGQICGIWVNDIKHAQLGDDFKSRLRMFVAWHGEEIPEYVYSAVAEGNFRVEENSPEGGGGYFLMLPGFSSSKSVIKNSYSFTGSHNRS